MATRNELVMSDAQIQAEMSSDVDNDVNLADDGEATSDPSLESDEDFSDWEDRDQDGDEVNAEGEDSAAAQQPQVRKFKANGREVDVDMSDQPGVDRLITMGLGARQVFSERDTLRKTLAAKDKQLAEAARYKTMWQKLDKMKSDHDGLYEAVYGRKFEDAYKERREWDDRYAAASPLEQQVMLKQREIDAEKRKIERERQEWEESKKETDTRVEQADRKELRAQLLPEFYKYEFSSKVDDPAHAEKLNAVLWKTTISNLKSYGDDVELTPEMIRKEFRATAELLGGAAKQAAKKEIKKVVEEKKQTSKQQAKVAATRNYSKGSMSDYSKEKDPVKLLKRMFAR